MQAVAGIGKKRVPVYSPLLRQGRAASRLPYPTPIKKNRRRSKGLVQMCRPAGSYFAIASGGWLGLISAKATWMMPPARPSATPMRQAMV